MFELSFTKLLVLGVLALLIFGPDKLPKMAAQAGRILRDLRRMADQAKADLTEGLGPEFTNFDVADLNPKHFVRKHLLDDLNGDSWDAPSPQATRPIPAASRVTPGELPPYDSEAT